MSVYTELDLTADTKRNIRAAIRQRGVNCTKSDPFSIYPTRIGQISMTPGTYDNVLKSLIERTVTSFTVPDSTEIIRGYCFNACTSLASITIPEGVTTIGEYVFQNCTSLTTVELPSTITNIGGGALYNCSGLTSITCLGTTPATLGGGSFYNTNDCPIYVPADSVDTYKTAWPQYASRIQAIPEVKFFRRISDINDVTSGKYLIVDTANNIALNASLIASTTSTTNGINTFGNYIDVGITGDTIEATATTLNAAVDYDGRYLTWTDEMYGTVYHLTQNGTNAVKFKPDATSSMYEITPFDDYECRTFQSPTKAIGLFTGTTSGSKTIRWQDKNTTASLENMALFKLD